MTATAKRKINAYSLMLTVIFLAVLLMGPELGYAADSQQRIDAVLSMDASTSMNDSDAKKVANEAMKMFIDMLSVQGDKVGIVSYTDQIVREKALLPIKSAQDKQELKSFIDQLSRGPYTDVAVGVGEAVKVLEAGREEGHYPLIVLLTDGNNSLNASAGRTQAASDEELQAAVKRAKELSIPIYAIGLNADGRLNRDVLQGVADDTGGKLFVTSSADDLPQILSEIFASHLKLKVVPLAGLTGNGEFQEIAVTVPNANVREANISIMSEQPVEIKLFNPSGQEETIPSDKLVYSQSKAYSLLKLLQPVQGEWKLHIKGVNQDKITVNLVYNYDLALVMEPLPAGASYKPGASVAVNAWLESEGQAVQDGELYNSLKGVALLTDKDSGQMAELPLTNTGSGFTGAVVLPEAHDYELKLRVEDANFLRETEAVAVTAKSAAAAPSTSPAASSSPGQSNPPGGEAKGFPWGYVLAGIGVLLLAAGLFLLQRFIASRNKGFYGQCVLEIWEEDTGRRSSPQYRPLKAFRGKVTLHQLLQLAPELAETERIVFTPGSDSLLLHNQSECLIEKSGRALDASRKQELKNKDRIRITLKNVNKSILLEYII